MLRTTLRRLAATALTLLLLVGCMPARQDSSSAILRIGAVFPLGGVAGSLARSELAGIQIAVDQANADGGVAGHRVKLEVRDLSSAADAPRIMAELRAEGVQIVMGAYASDLSIAASGAADAAGLLYWEAGAVADRLTGRGLPLVFRVGASGSNLGANSADFAAGQLANRLGRTPTTLRTAIVAARDDYAASVADAAARTAETNGLPVVARETYDQWAPDWPAVMAGLAEARPDVIVLASHIPDGIAFRRAMLAANLRVGALIGSTMAECDPDFAGELGADAVGVFASDRPTAGFRPEVLDVHARAVYDRFAVAWQQHPALPSGENAGVGDAGEYGGGHGYGSGESAYTISGPAEVPSAEASEEALAGFTAGWALLNVVLPAVHIGAFDAEHIAAAARAVDLPVGSLPNGAGLRFSSDPATLGQNLHAAAVIWQWQAIRHYEFVYPSAYATGPIDFVPLPR